MQFNDYEHPSLDASSLDEVEGRVAPEPETAVSNKTRCSKFCKVLGPAWLVACGLLDPGAVEGALQAGAFAGYSLLWVTFWTTVMVFAFQSFAAGIAIISGKSLAHVFRIEYKNRYLSYLVLAVIEISTIGDDFQALVGCTLAFQILFGLPFYAGVIISTALTLILTFCYYRSAKMLQNFVGLLMVGMTILYLIYVCYSSPAAGSVLYGLVVPQAPSYATLLIVGTIGGIITPSTLFLGSQMVLANPVDRNNPLSVKEAFRYSTYELSLGFIVSFLANAFLMTTFASSFFNESCAEQGLALVQGNCSDIGLEDAPDALVGLYGNAANYIFGVALFFSGQNSMISATLASQATFEGFLDKKISLWMTMIATRCISLIPTLILAFTTGQDDVSYSIANEWVNIIMALIMPFAMIPTIHIASSEKLMGAHALSRRTTAFMTLVILLILGINFYLLSGFLYDPLDFDSVGNFPMTPSFYSFIGAFMLAYAVFLFLVALPSVRRISHFISPSLEGYLGQMTHYSTAVDESKMSTTNGVCKNHKVQEEQIEKT